MFSSMYVCSMCPCMCMVGVCVYYGGLCYFMCFVCGTYVGLCVSSLCAWYNCVWYVGVFMLYVYLSICMYVCLCVEVMFVCIVCGCVVTMSFVCGMYVGVLI